MKSTLIILQLFYIATYLVGANHGTILNSNRRLSYGNNRNWKDTFRRVCYLRMDPKTKFEFKHIDGNLCTHIIYAFCRINSSGGVIFGTDSDKLYIDKAKNLKRKYPHLKLLISLYNDEEFKGFTQVAGNRYLIQRLATSAINFMTEHSFDGLDLDWEFPSYPKQNETERRGLTTIITELRKAFGQKYLLTAAVPAQERVFRPGYELVEISKNVDWLNLMTYDYYLWTSLTPFTGPNAPLYILSQTKYVPVANKLSVDWSVQEYIKMGVERDKIVMGIPTYSRGYKLLISTDPKPLRPAIRPHAGELKDYLVFPEVCAYLSSSKTKVHYDPIAEVPYLVSDSVWISFEDEQSIRAKVKYAISNKLGGYMTWNLNSDNFNKPCLDNPTRNLLHKTMLNTLETYPE